jgi:hypothetical protein
VIRQAISCDICGSEKKQTNHWFVAYEQKGELRLSGWQSKHTMRAKAKHLCGQKCVHRLLDEYMAAVSSFADAIGTSLEKPANTNLLSDVEEGAVLIPLKDQSVVQDEVRQFATGGWRKLAWEHELERQNEKAESSQKPSRGRSMAEPA